MSSDIERVNYYEREYLRSFDFDAEQLYHIEMRRRLNLALHRWGIVQGLDIQDKPPVPGAPTEATIMPGMAIDAYGREIVLFAPFALTEDYLHEKGISIKGTYDVWITYGREPATPPTPGYAVCDLTDQYTRWREVPQILVKDPTFTGPQPDKEPVASADLYDDPSKYPWPIRLGSIFFAPGADPSIKDATDPEKLVYIGLRAQRITSPFFDAKADFPILKPNSAVNPRTSVSIEANLFAQRNAIIGDNFEIIPADVPSNTSYSPKNPTGTLKVGGDAFLQGDLYTHCDSANPNNWLNLDECIRQCIKESIPDIQIGVEIITFTNAQSNTATGDLITTQLAQADPSKTRLITSLASIHLNKRSQVKDDIAAGDEFRIETSGSLSVAGDILTLSATVGPTHFNNTDFEVPVQSVAVTYVLIFHPKT